MDSAEQKRTVDRLLREHGTTFAAEAGIRLRNGPASLFQLLCLALLSGARIRASVAVAAARALRDNGWTNAEAMAAATWEERTRVLNRAGYARYDESTSRMLAATAELVLDRYGGDLRRLRDSAERDPASERRLLKEAKGVGDVAVNIFFREAQAVWPELAPFFDPPALAAAASLGLPTDPRALATCCDAADLPRFAAALVRVHLARPRHRHRS